MSQENVEIVGPHTRPWPTRGWIGGSSIGAAISNTGRFEGAPDDRGPIHGKDAMRAYVRDWIDLFDDFRIEPIELIDAGENTVVAIVRFGGRAKLSRVKTDQIRGAVLQIRDGKIALGREYATRSEALEAAGLSD